MLYVGNVICLKFVQERFKVLFEKELVKNMMYLVWELNPRLVRCKTSLTQMVECQSHEEF